jgi:hypothetical protein
LLEVAAGPTERRRPGAAEVRSVAIGVVLVTLFTFFFVYPAHDPAPNELPLAVVGRGPAIDGLEFELEQVDGGGAFDVKNVGDEAAARDAILDREIYAAIVPRGSAELLVASAAGPAVASAVTAVATELAAGAPPTVTDVRPIDDDDPRGVVINVALIAMSVTSILGALLLFTLAPQLVGRVRLAALAVFAVLGAVAAMLVVQVGIGALPGSFFVLVAVVALGIFAVSSVSAVLMQLVGPVGIGLSFMLFLMLGNPATGAASAPQLLPDPWSWAGQLLPPGALATAIRNVAYFDGAQTVSWLSVLAVWAAIGIVGLLLTRPHVPLRAPAGTAAGP